MTLCYEKHTKYKVGKYFYSNEFDCKCKYPECEDTFISEKLIRGLDKLRIKMNLPLSVSSGYRCAKHNKDVGGKRFSKHKKGIAADILCPKGMNYRYFYRLCLSVEEFKGIGYYEDRGFVHVDVRKRIGRWIG